MTFAQVLLIIGWMSLYFGAAIWALNKMQKDEQKSRRRNAR